MDLQEIQEKLRRLYVEIESLRNKIKSAWREYNVQFDAITRTGSLAEEVYTFLNPVVEDQRCLDRLIDRKHHLERHEFEHLRSSEDQRPVRLRIVDETIDKLTKSIVSYRAEVDKGDARASKWITQVERDVEIFREQRKELIESLAKPLADFGLKIS